ncbi:MAG: LacI family DNA-binding transcriptional regulator [Luteitalea sp.]|nr:LacI family DNA-binding transcriptional regulator [Luteitalea sp.]
MITIKDVARESGFAPTTVSIVLNDAPLAQYIPAQTKNRIKKAAEKLNYRPNPYARSLRSNRSHTIGVMVFDISDPYCANILKGIEDGLNESPYLLTLADTQNDRKRFEHDIEMLLERRIEGLITVANSLSLEIDVLTALKKRTIPTVIIGRNFRQAAMSTVVVNNEAGGRLALQHLYELGHRHIAFITGPRILVDSGDRWNGVLTYAQEVGLAIDPKLVMEVKEPTTGYQSGFELAHELVRRRRKFTAVLAFDDVTAFGVIRALNNVSRRVPEDCSVIGFDDVSMAACYNPPLTTVRQPMSDLGSIGVKLLLKTVQASLNKTPFDAEHLRVEPELVVRESTAPLPR